MGWVGWVQGCSLKAWIQTQHAACCDECADTHGHTPASTYSNSSQRKAPTRSCTAAKRTCRRLKAAAGLSPDSAASSPISALAGASRSPLLVRSHTCQQGGMRLAIFSGFKGCIYPLTGAVVDRLGWLVGPASAAPPRPRPALASPGPTLAKVIQERHAVMPSAVYTAPLSANMGLLTAVSSVPKMTILQRQNVRVDRLYVSSCSAERDCWCAASPRPAGNMQKQPAPTAGNMKKQPAPTVGNMQMQPHQQQATTQAARRQLA